MYPPQTSLIPATIALVKFFEARGFSAFFQNYPYWYLGSTPFKFLIGPVIPVLEVALKSLLSISLFSISIGLVVFFAILSGIGWILLIRTFLVKEKVFLRPISYLLLLTFYLLLPWKYFSGIALSELTSFIAFCLLPFVLLTFSKKIWISSLAVAFLLLINTNIVTSLLVGVTALAFARNKKRLKKYLISVGIGIIIATLWYGPMFWWVQIVNPGIGGGNAVKIIASLLNFIRGVMPLVLAVVAVNFKHKFDSKFAIFAWIFFGSFAILTIFRFMSNVDFWMDWTSWFTELEIGLFLVVTTNKKLFYLIIFSWVATLLAYNGLGKPALISDKPPKIVNLLPKLASLAGDHTVFVTGSNVFWLNSYYDTVQVRGGRDEVALDPNWRTAAYTFRESQSADKIMASIEKVGVTYVLVNSDSSPDFYKDFKNLSVWPTIATLEASEAGDYIYFIYNTY